MAANRPEQDTLNWSDLDRRAVDTIRVLAMDAVEKSGNGHPGTAMSLAPAAYLLFNRVMRHNPADPDWAGRDRFVLSGGPLQPDALHPALPRRVPAEPGRPQVAAAVGLAHPGPPRARPHPRRGDHHRPARPGPRQRGRHGDGRPPRARPARPGRRRRRLGLRPQRLVHRLRRRHRRGHQPRGERAGRTPEARQPLRHLRRQRDLDRGRHPHRQERGRRAPATPRTAGTCRPSTGAPATPRAATTTRTSRRSTRRWSPPGRDRPALLHRAAHDHRLAGAEQAEHRQDPRLGARRRRGRRDQEDARLRPGPDLRRRRRGARAHPRGAASAAARTTRALDRRLRRVGHRQPGAQGAAGPAAAPARCPTAGPRRCRSSPPTPRASPPAPPPARSSRRSPRSCPSSGAAPPTWPRATTPR